MPLEAVLFFDANMPKIQKCHDNNDCRTKESILCEHRFNFSAHIFHTTRRQTGFSDFQIVMYCFSSIQNKEQYARISESGRFFIITKDHDFLEDAEKIWKGLGDKKRPNLIFEPEIMVSWNRLKIFVHTIKCEKYGTDGHDDLLRTINELNARIVQLPN